MDDREGCLSFPELYAKVRRSKKVRVQAYNLKGELYEMTCEDLAARVWQHEIDHLDGKLFIDKMGMVGRMNSRKYLKQFEQEYAEAQRKGEIPPDRRRSSKPSRVLPSPRSHPPTGAFAMRIVMMGTGTFAEPTFEALLAGPDPVVGLFTQPDREGVQKRGCTRQTGRGMKKIAAEEGVPVFQPESINTPEGVAMLRGLRPDLLVVAAYGQILSKDVLAIPTQGASTSMRSLLPKYRGAAPVAWAILHGETQTGVTIIRMSAGLDAGDMLAKAAIASARRDGRRTGGAAGPARGEAGVETIERLRPGR